jgi:hypothetical protein
MEDLSNYCKLHDLFDCPYAHGPVIRTVYTDAITACPIRSLSASHYRDDGSCLCTPEEEQ